MVNRAVRGSERPFGGSRGQLEGLRGQPEGLGGQPGGLEGQGGGRSRRGRYFRIVDISPLRLEYRLGFGLRLGPVHFLSAPILQCRDLLTFIFHGRLPRRVVSLRRDTRPPK